MTNTPPRLLAYVRLPDRTTLYRAVHLPEEDGGDLIVVERQTTDALGTPCWEAESQEWVERAVIHRALIGGEGVTRPDEDDEGGSLEAWRHLVAWCELHQVHDPMSLQVAWEDDAQAYVGRAQIDLPVFERLAEGAAVQDDGTPNEFGAIRVTAVVDGILLVSHRYRRLEVAGG